LKGGRWGRDKTDQGWHLGKWNTGRRKARK